LADERFAVLVRAVHPADGRDRGRHARLIDAASAGRARRTASTTLGPDAWARLGTDDAPYPEQGIPSPSMRERRFPMRPGILPRVSATALRLIALAIAAATVSACGPSTTIEQAWRAPITQYQRANPPLQRVV